MGTSVAERPLVAILAAGGPQVGLGHVRRCLALAQELRQGSEVCFFLQGSEGVAALIRSEGFGCARGSEGLEAALAAVAVSGAHALVIDDYRVTAQDYAAARARIGFLAVLDDSGRYPLPADLVVNPTPEARAPDGDEGTRYLLGPRFALLRREFLAPVARQQGGEVRRLLLMLGGAPPAPLLVALARAMGEAIPAAVLDVVVGPLADAFPVAGALSGLARVRLHRAPESVRALMCGADVAVTGGGVTVFELAACGTPAVGVELAANQEPNLRGMARAGTLVVAGQAGQSGLETAVARILSDLAADAGRRRAMSRRGLELVDSRGAARVAEAIRARLLTRQSVGGPAA